MANVNAPALTLSVAPPPKNASSQAPEPASQTSFADVLKARTHASKPSTDSTQKSAAPSQNKDIGTQEAKSANEQPGAEASGRADETLDTRSLAAKLSQQELLGLTSEEREERTDSLGLEAFLSQAALQDPASLAAALAANTASLAAKQSVQNQGATEVDDADALLASEDGSNPRGRLAQLLGEQASDTRAEAAADQRLESLADNPSTAIEPKAGEASRNNSFSSELALAQGAHGTNAPSAHALAHNSMQPGHTDGALPRHEVSTPVASRGWADDVGQKLTWISTRDNGRAELVLNPPQMGRVEVSINLQGDQASAVFSAANPLAREALQDAMPRLREVLSQAGIQLGQANVNAGQQGQAQADNRPARSAPHTPYSGQDTVPLDSLLPAAHSGWSRSGRGMVDIFA